jgi:hypothetical protein
LLQFIGHSKQSTKRGGPTSEPTAGAISVRHSHLVRQVRLLGGAWQRGGQLCHYGSSDPRHSGLEKAQMLSCDTHLQSSSRRHLGLVAPDTISRCAGSKTLHWAMLMPCPFGLPDQWHCEVWPRYFVAPMKDLPSFMGGVSSRRVVTRFVQALV